MPNQDFIKLPCPDKGLPDEGGSSPIHKRILLVDDDRSLLNTLVSLLRLERPEWEVGTANSGEEALSSLRAQRPDLLVSDIQMPGLDGLGLLSVVRSDPDLATLPLIFMTAKDDRASLREGMSSGADDYLTKPFSIEELTQAIEGRFRRKVREAGTLALDQELKAQVAKVLSRREREVLALIGRGLVTKDIASSLVVSPRTVSSHREHIMRKLDTHNAAALAALAVQAGLL